MKDRKYPVDYTFPKVLTLAAGQNNSLLAALKHINMQSDTGVQTTLVTRLVRNPSRLIVMSGAEAHVLNTALEYVCDEQLRRIGQYNENIHLLRGMQQTLTTGETT